MRLTRILRKMKGYAMSFWYPILIAIPISPIQGWFEKYIYGDWEFLKFLVILMVVDTFLGIWNHFKKKDLSLEGFEKILIKLICYGSALIVAHNLSSFQILGSSIDGFSWFRSTICTALVIRESLSIFKQIDKLSPGTIPSRIRKYLKYYDDNGEMKEK